MMNSSGGRVMTGHENHIGMQEETVKVKRVKVDEKFQEQLKNVFGNYNALKDALVNDDNSTAQKSANDLIATLKKVDMKLLTQNESHNLWMGILAALNSAVEGISNSTDIKIQREYFISLSNNISKSVELFGINQKIYKQFCPMANNDKGAFWLSTEEQIRNPYFGEMMLKCGSVEGIIN